MADPVVTVAGLQLHPPLSDGTGFSLDDDQSTPGLDGWYGAPDPKVAYTAKPAAAGSFWSPFAYDGERVITCTGTLVQSSSVAFLAAQRQLTGLCPDPTQLYTFTVADDLGTLSASVQRSLKVLTKPLSNTACNFSVAFTAPDPRRYDLANQASGTTAIASSTGGLDWATGGGLDWATGGGLNWGTATSSGSISLTNPGTADTWPFLTLIGPLTNPAVTNTTTGQVNAFSGSIPIGSTVTIDTQSGTVLLNGSTDRRSSLTSAQWFSAAPASTMTLTLTTSNAGDTGTLTVLINPAYW